MEEEMSFYGALSIMSGLVLFCMGVGIFLMPIILEFGLVLVSLLSSFTEAEILVWSGLCLILSGLLLESIL